MAPKLGLARIPTIRCRKSGEPDLRCQARPDGVKKLINSCAPFAGYARLAVARARTLRWNQRGKGRAGSVARLFAALRPLQRVCVDEGNRRYFDAARQHPTAAELAA